MAGVARGVAQFGQRARFGSVRSPVQIRAPRLKTSQLASLASCEVPGRGFRPQPQKSQSSQWALDVSTHEITALVTGHTTRAATL
jgi:hypothetical protein